MSINTNSDNSCKEEDFKQLCKVLIELKLIETEDELPQPYREASGMAGCSRVYFFSLYNNGTPFNFVAKFDKPERAEREWSVINELRNRHISLLAMLPLPGNHEEHGVVLYQEVAMLTEAGKIVDLNEQFKRQFQTNSANCIKVLDKIFKCIGIFYSYEPGAAHIPTHANSSIWKEVFGKVSNRISRIIEVADETFSLNWEKDDDFNPQIEGYGLTLPNPVKDIEKRMEAMTGKVMLSRVHGDLNFSNVLVSLDGSHTPKSIFLIDLANSKSSVPTAVDLARLESELWHETFVDQKSDENEEERLLFFVSLRDYLEGRTQSLNDNYYNSPLFQSTIQTVICIRSEALFRLRGQLPNYSMEDYFTALYFSHLNAVTFPSVKDDPLKRRIALLGAALSLKYIKDLEAGLYPDQLSNPVQRLDKMKNDSIEFRKSKDFIPGTFIQIGDDIIIEGIWIAADDNIWQFSVQGYIYGNDVSLKDYISNYSNLQEHEKYLVVESQGDGRLINKPPKWENINDRFIIEFSVNEKLPKRDPNTLGRNIALNEYGDPIIKNGNMDSVYGVENAKQRMSTTLFSQKGDYLHNNNLGSFCAKHYNNHKSTKAVLEKLLKLEIARLSTIPTFGKTCFTDTVPLDFVNRVIDLDIKNINSKKNIVNVFIKVEWGNQEIGELSISLELGEIRKVNPNEKLKLFSDLLSIDRL